MAARIPDAYTFLSLDIVDSGGTGAVFAPKEFMECGQELEPSFWLRKRRHLADEVGHVQWDEQLLDCVWPATGEWLRRINARALRVDEGRVFYDP